MPQKAIESQKVGAFWHRQERLCYPNWGGVGAPSDRLRKARTREVAVRQTRSKEKNSWVSKQGRDRAFDGRMLDESELPLRRNWFVTGFTIRYNQRYPAGVGRDRIVV